MENIIFDWLKNIIGEFPFLIAIGLFVGAIAGYRFSEKIVKESKAEVAAVKAQLDVKNDMIKSLESTVREVATEFNSSDLANRLTMRRETSFGQAVERAGIVDIEWRDTKTNLLPPAAFYAAAKSEVFILGVSCKNTFTNDAEDLKRLLQSGTSVRVLLLDPECEHANLLGKREGFALEGEIRNAIELAYSKGLYAFNQLFSIRLTSENPVYTGVMIDGDIDCAIGRSPRDTGAQIRIQPRTFFKSQHSGLICQFKITHETGPYQYFSEDLRQLWRSSTSAVHFDNSFKSRTKQNA